MTVEEWNALSQDAKEKLVTTVFNNQYLSMRASKNPETDVIIQEVLNVTYIEGNVAYVNIHKKVKIR
jgi:hypothetical protein